MQQRNFLFIIQKQNFVLSVIKNFQKQLWPNLLITCSKSANSSKKLSVEYFEQLKENIGNKNAIMVLDKSGWPNR